LNGTEGWADAARHARWNRAGRGLDQPPAFPGAKSHVLTPGRPREPDGCYHLECAR
jgi:hypothetical protein